MTDGRPWQMESVEARFFAQRLGVNFFAGDYSEFRIVIEGDRPVHIFEHQQVVMREVHDV